MNILKKFFTNTNPNSLQKRVEDVQSVIDTTDFQKESARKIAIDVAIRQIKEHPDMPVGDFMQMLQEETSLTDDDIATIIKKIPIIKSEKATIAAIQSTSLSDEAITDIVKEAPISLDTAEKIVNEIEDKNIQKEQQTIIATERENKILKQLSKIYDTCDNIEDPLLVELIDKLDIQEFTVEINKKLMSIISKRTAIDCMKFGTPRIPTLIRILPPIDMFESDLPFLAFKEYKYLKSEFDGEGKTYIEFTDNTKKLIHKKILEELAKKSAENFDTSGLFALPQTKKFRELSAEDIHLFIKTVKTYSRDFDRSASRRLTRQLNGESATELHDLNTILEKMNPNERDIAIQKIVAFLRSTSIDSKSSKTNVLLDKALKNIELSIKRLPLESQLLTAQTILDTLEQRNEATLLIKRAKKSNPNFHPNDGSR